jgi:hypothetical protein
MSEPTPTLIDGFAIDATIAKDLSLSSDVVRHAVEEGANLVDHIRNNPTLLVLDCVVSNTPLGQMAARRGTDALPTDQAYARMLGIHTARAPITIEIGEGIFPMMVLEHLGRPVTNKTGDAIRFRAAFVQIRTVSTERVTIEVAVPRAARKVNRGNKASADAAPPAATGETLDRYNDSWLGQITDAVGITH